MIFEPGEYQVRKPYPENVTSQDIQIEDLGIDPRNKWAQMIVCYIINNAPYEGVNIATLQNSVGSKYKLKDNLMLLITSGVIERRGAVLYLTDEAKVRSGVFHPRHCQTPEEFRKYALGYATPIQPDEKDEPLTEEQAEDILRQNQPKKTKKPINKPSQDA